MTTRYDRDAYAAACQRMTSEPKSLTDTDIDQLMLVDPDIGKRARAARDGFVVPQPPAVLAAQERPLRWKWFLRWIEDSYGLTLATYRYHARLMGKDIEALMRRCAELESALAIQRSGPSTMSGIPIRGYQGVWEPTRTYEAGDVTTHDGSLWIARAITTARPGTSSEASRVWTLCVKRGVDAPDTRELRKRIDALERRLQELEGMRR